jgi:hypothetical protein
MAKANLLPTLGEGFKLIAREPLSVLAWGLVSLAAALIPSGLYFALMGGELVDYYRELFQAAGDDAADMPVAPSSAAVGLIQLLQWAAYIVSGAVVYAAVYRAILRPDERGFARMRLGQDELYVGLVTVILVVLLILLLMVGTIVLMIPIGIGFAIAGAAGGANILAVLVGLLALAAMVGVALLYSRFGMALPMTFAERRIRVFEAWTLTKGYSGQLLLMAFLQMLIIIGLYIAAMLAIFAAAAGSFIGVDPASWQEAISGAQVLERFSGAIVVAILVYALMFFILTPIMLAPWARAYQLILKDKLEGRTEVFT